MIARSLCPASVGFIKQPAQVAIDVNLSLCSGEFRLVREFALNPGYWCRRVFVVTLKPIWLHRPPPNISFQATLRKKPRKVPELHR